MRVTLPTLCPSSTIPPKTASEFRMTGQLNENSLFGDLCLLEYGMYGLQSAVSALCSELDPFFFFSFLCRRFWMLLLVVLSLVFFGDIFFAFGIFYFSLFLIFSTSRFPIPLLGFLIEDRCSK